MTTLGAGCVAISPCGRFGLVGQFPWFAATKTYSVHVLALSASGIALVAKLDRHRKGLMSVAFDSTAEHFVSTSVDGCVCYWAFDRDRHQATLAWEVIAADTVDEARFDPSGRFLLLRGRGPTLAVLDVGDGRTVWTRSGASSREVFASFTQSGAVLVWKKSEDHASVFRPPAVEEVSRIAIERPTVRSGTLGWRSCVMPDGRLVTTTQYGEVFVVGRAP